MTISDGQYGDIAVAVSKIKVTILAPFDIATSHIAMSKFFIKF